MCIGGRNGPWRSLTPRSPIDVSLVCYMPLASSPPSFRIDSGMPRARAHCSNQSIQPFSTVAPRCGAEKRQARWPRQARAHKKRRTSSSRQFHRHQYYSTTQPRPRSSNLGRGRHRPLAALLTLQQAAAHHYYRKRTDGGNEKMVSGEPRVEGLCARTPDAN